MTHDELILKAIEWLGRLEPTMPDSIRGVTPDRLPKRRLRDAVVIDFTSDEERGSIRVVMDRETGDLIETSHSPPRTRTGDDNRPQPRSAPSGGLAAPSDKTAVTDGPPEVS